MRTTPMRQTDTGLATALSDSDILVPMGECSDAWGFTLAELSTERARCIAIDVSQVNGSIAHLLSLAGIDVLPFFPHLECPPHVSGF